MTEQLKEIGQRLAMLREIRDLDTKAIAEQIGISEQDYLSYESGDKDFSFSFLYNAAAILGVDVLDLMSGESPKLSICSVVRNGEGYEIKRRKAYDYQHLAYTFRNKAAEPFLVTVEPKEPDFVPTLHNHEGQEFNYLLSGAMQFYIGDISYEIGEGDSLYFDSNVPHAMKALGGKPARFLAVVIQKPQSL